MNHPSGGAPPIGRSLASTLALALVTLSVLTLLLASGLQLLFTLRTQQAAISSSQQLIAQGAAASVSGFVREQTSALETAVKLSDARTASRASWTRTLQGLLGLQPSLKHLAVLDADDRVLAHASRGSQAASASFAASLTGDRLAAIRRDERSISPVFIDPASSEPQVLLAVPVVDALGDRHGTLVADVNLKFMWDLVQQLEVGAGGYAYVVDRDGNLLAFNDTARVLRGENVAQVEAVRRFAATPPGASVAALGSYPGLTGATVVGAVVPLATPDWAVITETPWELAYRDSIQGALAVAGGLAAMTLLAGALGLFLARRLTAPLVALTSTATRIAAGERDLQVAVGGPREVANLAAAFNSMTAQLRVTLGELEDRVARRTADLRAALAEVEARSQEQTRLLEENAQQRLALRELGVPVLPVNERTLVLPLIGAVDTLRLTDIQERALQAIEETSARRLLLDITGVPVVDTQVAQGLLGLADMARLLGAEVMLIGIRPEVAQTIVGLGLDLARLPTAADLQTALRGRRPN